MNLSRFLALALAVLLLADGGFAQGAVGQAPNSTPPEAVLPSEPNSPEIPATNPLEVPQRPGIRGETKLPLKDVIAMALDNYRNLLVSRIAAGEALLNVNGAKGYYDPVFGLNA